MRNDQLKLGCLGYTHRPALESDIMNFKPLISIYIISLNFRTICLVLTEISARQNLSRIKKQKKNEAKQLVSVLLWEDFTNKSSARAMSIMVIFELKRQLNLYAVVPSSLNSYLFEI